MYKPITMPPPLFNNMGFRPPGMLRLKGWICGPTANDSCPLGERMAGACSHCSTAMYLAAVLASNPQLFRPKARSCHLLDRGNPQAMDEEITSEVTS